MAYVPIQYPQVLYDSTGLPVTVRNADAAATLPSTFAPVPTTAAALVAFPPAVIAQVAKIPPPIAVALPSALSTLIAINTPKSNGKGNN
mgnify:CR=1 FL=1